MKGHRVKNFRRLWYQHFFGTFQNDKTFGHERNRGTIHAEAADNRAKITLRWSIAGRHSVSDKICWNSAALVIPLLYLHRETDKHIYTMSLKHYPI